MKVTVQSLTGSNPKKNREVIKSVSVFTSDEFREVETFLFQSRDFDANDLLDKAKSIDLASRLKEAFFLAGINKNHFQVSIRF